MLVLATCAALHPVFTWTALRAVDGSDEPWGIGALVAVVVLIATRYREASAVSAGPGLAGPALWLAFYAVSYPWLTPLPRGILAMTALALLLSRFYFGTRLSMGLLGLLLLGLPLIASVQFYLGYPLRVAVASATAVLVRMGGFNVNVVGVGLELGAQTITVDAPCSGVKMLWVGGFAASLLAVLRRFNVRETIAFMLGTAICLFVANVLRAAALFYVELRLVALPEGTHSAVGLVMFAVALAMIAVLSRFFRGARNHA